MNIMTRLTLLLFFFLITHSASAQTTAAFPSLTYPHSIFSSGMGEQGVTLPNAAEAMQFNPANLAFADHASLSFYRFPWARLNMPVTSVSASYKFSNGMTVGAEYTNWDQGTFQVTTVEFPDGTGETFHIYERSIAGALAVPLGDKFSLGAELRYAMSSFWTISMRHVSLSAGAAYVPSERMHVGLSLMNFSTPVEYSTPVLQYDDTRNPVQVATTNNLPMPARIEAGADYAIARHSLFDLTVMLGFTKPLDKRDYDGVYQSPLGYRGVGKAESSFRSLFTAWSDFPEDVTTHIGLHYRFRPLPLGGGISFFQEMMVGYLTMGTSANYQSLFTNGVVAGIEFNGVRASAGYAGKWHDYYFNPYFRNYTLSESFQFTISTDGAVLGMSESHPQESNRPSGILVSGGYSHCTQVGRMDKMELNGAIVKFSQPALWSIEGDFYMSDNSALVASLGYAHLNETITIPSTNGLSSKYEEDNETFALESGYRFHPIDAFHPLFFQASLGIIRLNPVDVYTGQRHFYHTYDNLFVGCVIPVGAAGWTVMPKAGLKTIFMDSIPNISKLSGYSQIEIGVNVGYIL